jgi:hypothetical protein
MARNQEGRKEKSSKIVIIRTLNSFEYKENPMIGIRK